MQKKNLQNVQQINYQQNLSLEKQNGNKMQKQKYKKKNLNLTNIKCRSTLLLRYFMAAKK